MLTAAEYPYQTVAIERALERKSVLCAFEMGTGKTFIGIAVAEELLGQGLIETAAIVVPASLKWQWAGQIAKLTDVATMPKRVKVEGETFDLTIPTTEHCVVIDGDPKKRAAQYAAIKASPPEYVILGYENVLNDWRSVRRINPGMIVLDECTAIKSFTAARTKKIKRWTAEYRIGLTGTPMDNGKPEELFSILQWVDDTVLGRFDLFDKSFIARNQWGGVERYKNLPVLHAKLSDVVVRATRADPEVARFLPTTSESYLSVDLDPETRKAYEHIGTDLLAQLKKAAENPRADFDLFTHYHGGGDALNQNTQQGKIMARMQALDMLLNHPDLIVLSGEDYEASQRAREAGEEKATWPGSKYCYEVWQTGILDAITETPKLDRLVEDIRRAIEDPAAKVIVFSYYKRMAEFIIEALEGVGTVPYHGDMSSNAKAGSVARFREDPDTRVIVCSHAGAYGTDLYMANYLYNYDLAWSSGTQDQINGRHSRAASAFKDIFVINMVTKNTTEERKPKVLAFKRKTASAILDNTGADEMGRVDNDVASLSETLVATMESAA